MENPAVITSFEYSIMTSDNSDLFLYTSKTGEQFASVTATPMDVKFPPGIRWTDVLDCRISPFTTQPLEEVCEFAQHVNKPYILVTGTQITDSTPLKEDV